MADEVKAVIKSVKEQDVSEMDAEIKRAELELKRLEILEKQANLQDLQERLNERQLKRDNKEQVVKTNGATLAQNAAREVAAQARCNHKKGGNGVEGILGGQGDDSQYAVFKHQFANGDVWVRCLRCGKTWKPPVEASFYFRDGKAVAVKDGTFDKDKFEQAWREYKEAVAFTTRNVMSGSIQVRFSDGGETYRQATKDSTLR